MRRLAVLVTLAALVAFAPGTADGCDGARAVHAARAPRATAAGRRVVHVVPHSHYPSADGKWIAIACTSDKMFARLADAMDAPELASPERFGLIAKRLEERPEVNRIVAEWTSSLPQEELLAKLKAGRDEQVLVVHCPTSNNVVGS